MSNVLEEYLVKLGFQIDNKAFGKVKEAFGNINKNLANKIPASAQVAVKGTSLFAQALMSANVEIIKMADQVAKADMQYQLLAQRMFMSVQAAKAFTLASETMGHNLQEIAWNAELREKYFDLVDQINKLEIPQEQRDMLKQVRNIGHEFDRLKLAGKLSIEWLAIHLLNLNKGALKETKNSLREITTNIFDKIPTWTKQVASYLDIPIQIGKTIIRIFSTLWKIISPPLVMLGKGITSIWNLFKPYQKEFLVLSGVLVGLFLAPLSPIAALVAAAGGFILLIEDFFGYLEGKKSSELLAPFFELFLFLNGKLQKVLFTIIIAAEHAWAALTRKKHYTGKSFAKDLEDTMKDLDKTANEERQKRFDAIAAQKQEAKAKTVAPSGAPTPTKLPTAVAPSGAPTPTKLPTAVAPSGAPTPTKLPTAVAPQEKELLNVIARGEGTSDEQARKKGYSSGYDVTLGYGAYGGKTAKPLTEMTLAEIEQHQTKMLADPKNKLNSSALGKYQFTKSTLFGSGKDVGEIARLGISKDEKFTPELQDRLALALIGKQTEQFKKGSISQSQYQNVLAGRWASIARADTGLSQYRQRVGTTSSDLAEILPGIKSAPPGSPTYAKASVGGEGTYNVNRTNILARIRREKQALPGYTGAGPLQAPPGYPVYAKAPTGGEGNYSINVTVNAQTNASPKEIADETQKAIIKSSRDMKREKTIRDRVGASS